MGDKLSRKQKLALPLFAQGMSNREVAAEVGVSLRTVEGWKGQAEFSAAISQAQEEVYRQAIENCSGYAQRAVEKIFEIMNDPDVPAKTQLSAAKEILGYAEKYQGLKFEQRLSAIEEQLNMNNGHPHQSAAAQAASRN